MAGHYDIAVIGLGPAGATLARLLSPRFRVLALDRKGGEEGFRKPCGGLLAPDAQRALARSALSLPTRLLVDPQIFSVRTLDGPSGRVREYPRCYINLDRHAFDLWLISLIPSHVDIRRPARCTSITRGAAGYQIRWREGGRENEAGATFVVGADGAASLVRRTFFPRARIRFVRYEGTEAKVGAEMNVIKDVVFEGRILQVTEKALEFVRGQIKERTYLGADTRFVTEPEYPEFAWKELIVNAVAHRDYSIKGTDIQIKMFDDRLTVESPGTLPGIVRLNNMRHVHFSRNPKIAQFLHEYEYVQEFGEGVDRLYEVMETAGLPQPEYRVEAFMLYATIRNTKTDANLGDTPQVTPQVKIIAFCSEPRSKAEIANHCGFKDIKHFTARYLKPLLESGQLRMTAPDKPNSSKQKYITVQPSQ